MNPPIESENLDDPQLKIVKVETVLMNEESIIQFFGIKEEPQSTGYVNNTKEGSVFFPANKMYDGESLHKLAAHVHDLQTALNQAWCLFPSYKPTPQEMIILGLHIGHAGPPTDEEVEVLRTTLEGKKFGPSEGNCGIENLESLLMSIPGSWTVSEKYTILSWNTALLTRKITQLINLDANDTKPARITDLPPTWGKNIHDYDRECHEQWKTKEFEILLRNLHPNTSLKPKPSKLVMKHAYIKLHRLPSDINRSCMKSN